MRASRAWLLYSLGACFCVSAQAAGGIAIIKSHDINPYNQAISGFSETCSNNVTQYNLGGNKARQSQVAEEIHTARPKLVLAVGLLAARMAKDMLRDFPILYVMVSTPKKYGLVGNNIAGISLNIPVESQFKTYKTLLPGLKTIGVIYDPEKTADLIRDAQTTGKKLGLQIVAVAVSSQKEVPDALRKLVGKVDTLWMIPDETVVTTESFKYFLVTTLENSLPFLAASDIFVEGGALASLNPDYADVGRQSCELAAALLNGQLQLSDLDEISPKRVHLSINLKTAKKIGLTLPRSVIDSAHVVYQ